MHARRRRGAEWPSGDDWDLDHPFERLLIDTAVAPNADAVAWINPRLEAGEVRKVMTGIPGKTGVVYTLDRETAARGVSLVYVTHQRGYRRRSPRGHHETVPLGEQAGSRQLRAAIARSGAVQPRGSPPDARIGLGWRPRRDAGTRR